LDKPKAVATPRKLAVIPPSVPEPRPSVAECDTPTAAAKVLTRVEAIYPKSELANGQSLSADVRVDLRVDGTVRHTAIVQSSGSADFDNAAIDAATISKYAAPIENCAAQEGWLIFHVTFVPVK
jgi:TonB family protein